MWRMISSRPRSPKIRFGPLRRIVAPSLGLPANPVGLCGDGADLIRQVRMAAQVPLGAGQQPGQRARVRLSQGPVQPADVSGRAVAEIAQRGDLAGEAPQVRGVVVGPPGEIGRASCRERV